MPKKQAERNWIMTGFGYQVVRLSCFHGCTLSRLQLAGCRLQVASLVGAIVMPGYFKGFSAVQACCERGPAAAQATMARQAVLDPAPTIQRFNDWL
jgi:hypothetical protein